MWQQNNANNSNTQAQHAPRCWLEEHCATLAHTRSAVDGEAAVLGCSICLDLQGATFAAGGAFASSSFALFLTHVESDCSTSPRDEQAAACPLRHALPTAAAAMRIHAPRPGPQLSPAGASWNSAMLRSTASSCRAECHYGAAGRSGSGSALSVLTGPPPAPEPPFWGIEPPLRTAGTMLSSVGRAVGCAGPLHPVRPQARSLAPGAAALGRPFAGVGYRSAGEMGEPGAAKPLAPLATPAFV